jgi:hypothetical protein
MITFLQINTQLQRVTGWAFDPKTKSNVIVGKSNVIVASYQQHSTTRQSERNIFPQSSENLWVSFLNITTAMSI